MTESDVKSESGSSDSDCQIAEWVAARLDAGEPIDEAAIAAAYPGRADRLRRVISALNWMERLRDMPADKSTSIGVLGDFRTVRVLGRGGMGVVYEAVQLSLNRRVALKILPGVSASDPRRLRRFQIEAQAVACLNHPHIVPIHVVGEAEGVHFFAMQLIEGRTLADVIAAGEPTCPRAAAELGRQAAEALHYAHEQGVIHRDVKPSNLMIDGAARLWITDFGLARIGGSADLTATGDLLGTLRYASPEQALGPRGFVDQRTDVYSLGVTIYERLALRPAFEGEGVELLRRIADDVPVPLRRIDSTIPRDLETIVLKAMARDPTDRYPTARALADDLSRFLDDRPILARPPSLANRAARWSRRHRSAVVAGAVLLVAGLVGLEVAASWRYQTLRRHNVELKAALDVADQQQRLTRRHWYDSQIRLTQQALGSGQTEFGQELLGALRPRPGTRDLRGFDWYYLHRASHREVSVFEADAFGLMPSPDGRTLALQGRFGLLLWNLAEWRERGRSPAQIDGFSYSSDGQSLVSWSGNGSVDRVRVRDAASGVERTALPPIDGGVLRAAFSSDGRTLILLAGSSGSSHPPRVEFWDISPGLAGPRPKSAPILTSAAAVSADGRILVLADQARRIVLRDLANGRTPVELPVELSEIGEISVSPNARAIAVTQSGAITFLDAVSGRTKGTITTPLVYWPVFSPDGSGFVGRAGEFDRPGLVLVQNATTSPHVVPLEGVAGTHLQVAFSPDGATLAAGGVGLPATLWDVATGRRRAQFPGNTGDVGPMSFTTDGRSLIFASASGRVRSWHFTAPPEPVATIAGYPTEVWTLAFTPDGSTLISAGDDHAIRLWNPTSGRLRATLGGHDALVTSLAVSPDGSTLASAGFDRTVRLWDLAAGRSRAVLQGHTDRVRAVAFSTDGRTLASAGSDGTVRLWNATAGTPLQVFKGHSDAVRALAFQPGGALLASSSNDRTIRIWDTGHGRSHVVLTGSKQYAALAFTPDGSQLASGDDWGVVSIRDVATWAERMSAKGGDAPVWGLSFSPDGQTLAAACGDAKVRLVDPLTGQVTLVLEGHARRVNAVAFSPDGRTLASADHEGVIKLWRAGDAPRLQTAHADEPRMLSDAERVRRLHVDAR